MYRKVCRPHDWQVSVSQAIKASVGIALFSALASVPYVLLYGVRTLETPCPHIQGSDCFVDDSYTYTVWPLLNNLLFIVVFLGLSTSLIVLYLLIGRKAWRHSKIPGSVVRVTTCQPPGEVNHGCDNCSYKTDLQCEYVKSNRVIKESWYHKLLFYSYRRFRKENARRNSTVPILITRRDSVFSVQVEDLNSGLNDENQRCEEPCCQNPGYTGDVLDTGHENTSTCDVKQCMSRCDVLDTGHEDISTCDGNQCMSRSEDLTNVNNEIMTAPEELSCKTDEGQIANTQGGILSGPINLKTGFRKVFKRLWADNNVTKQKVEMSHAPDRRKPLNRMTLMLILISAIYILGFCPFLALTTIKSRLPQVYANLTTVESTFFNLFYRLYFINTAVNPVVYSLCDRTFRQSVVRLVIGRFKRAQVQK